MSVCGRECECVCECECVNGGDGVGPGRPPHRLQLGGAPPPLCSPSPSPRLSPSLPASPSVAGALSQRWCWRRSGALRTLSPSSASPRRPFEARRPWWRTRSRCSAGVLRGAGERPASAVSPGRPGLGLCLAGAACAREGARGGRERRGRRASLRVPRGQGQPVRGFVLPLQGQPPQHRGSGGCPREPFPPLPGHGAVRRGDRAGRGAG